MVDLQPARLSRPKSCCQRDAEGAPLSTGLPVQNPATQSLLAHPKLLAQLLIAPLFGNTVLVHRSSASHTRAPHTADNRCGHCTPAEPMEPTATALPYSTSRAQELPHSNTGLCIAWRQTWSPSTQGQQPPGICSWKSTLCLGCSAAVCYCCQQTDAKHRRPEPPHGTPTQQVAAPTNPLSL